MNDTSIDPDFSAAIAYITKREAYHARRWMIVITICVGSLVLNALMVVLAWVMP